MGGFLYTPPSLKPLGSNNLIEKSYRFKALQELYPSKFEFFDMSVYGVRIFLVVETLLHCSIAAMRLSSNFLAGDR
jgi:hypothetical protein